MIGMIGVEYRFKSNIPFEEIEKTIVEYLSRFYSFGVPQLNHCYGSSTLSRLFIDYPPFNTSIPIKVRGWVPENNRSFLNDNEKEFYDYMKKLEEKYK